MSAIGAVRCPTGGTPPMAKPVASRTKSASARAIGSPTSAEIVFSFDLVNARGDHEHRTPARGAKHERLRDLRDLAADRRRRLLGGARAGVEFEHLEP